MGSMKSLVFGYVNFLFCIKSDLFCFIQWDSSVLGLHFNIWARLLGQCWGTATLPVWAWRCGQELSSLKSAACADPFWEGAQPHITVSEQERGWVLPVEKLESHLLIPAGISFLTATESRRSDIILSDVRMCSHNGSPLYLTGQGGFMCVHSPSEHKEQDVWRKSFPVSCWAMLWTHEHYTGSQNPWSWQILRSSSPTSQLEQVDQGYIKLSFEYL